MSPHKSKSKVKAKPSKFFVAPASPTSPGHSSSLSDGSATSPKPALTNGHAGVISPEKHARFQTPAITQQPPDEPDIDDHESDSSDWSDLESEEEEGKESRPITIRQRSTPPRTDSQYSLDADNAFMKRVPSELRMQRGPSALSMLFRPDPEVLRRYNNQPSHMLRGDGQKSAADLRLTDSLKSRPSSLSTSFLPNLKMSKSAAALPATTLATTMSTTSRTTQAHGRLGGMPATAEFDSDSDSEETDSQPSPLKVENGRNITAELIYRERMQQTSHLAIPSSPSTTRARMLSTELSASLRKQLLWERTIGTRGSSAALANMGRGSPKRSMTSPGNLSTMGKQRAQPAEDWDAHNYNHVGW